MEHTRTNRYEVLHKQLNIVNENSSMKNDNKKTCFDILPDEMLVTIGRWVTAFGTCHFAQFQMTCKRFREILSKPEVFLLNAQDRVGSSLLPSRIGMINTVEQLGLLETMSNAGLFQENRIGFVYASTMIDDETTLAHENDNTSRIKDSVSRIHSVRELMQQFHNTTVIVDAHCGTSAPSSAVALVYSRLRAMVVSGQLLERTIDEEAEAAVAAENLDAYAQDRLILRAWGQQVVDAASRSTHACGELAREGKGWVELFVRLGDWELPARPDFYEGLSLAE